MPKSTDIEDKKVEVTEDESVASAPVEDKSSKKKAAETSSLVLVNASKKARAERIIGLVTGKIIPANKGELERKEKFTQHFTDNEMSPKSEQALLFVYEKLGGLVRTPVEQMQAEQKAEEIKKKGKKKMIE